MQLLCGVFKNCASETKVFTTQIEVIVEWLLRRPFQINFVCYHLRWLYFFHHEVQNEFSTLSRSQTNQVRRLLDFVPHSEMVAILRLTVIEPGLCETPILGSATGGMGV
jgi:hypothetical protein